MPHPGQTCSAETTSRFQGCRVLWRGMLLVAFLAITFPLTVLGAQPDSLEVRVGAYDNYPKIFPDESSAYRGLFPDIVEHIAAQRGWRLTWVPGSWSECLARLESGDIDMMVDVAYSEARARTYAFNKESALLNWGTVYFRGDLEGDGVTDLAGKRIAVMRGSIHTTGADGIKALLDRFDVQPGQYVEVDSYKDVFDLLDTDQADAGVVNRIFGAVFEGDYNVRKTSIFFNPRRLHFAFPRQGRHTPALIEAVDQSLKVLKQDQDSVYYQALDRYLSVRDVRPAESGADAPPGSVTLTDEEKAWVRAHPVIRYAVDPEFVPYEFLGPDGAYTGIASDYLQLLGTRLGLHFERMQDVGWAQALDLAGKGKIDLLPCVGKTDARKEFLLFSRPYTQFHRVIITQAEAPFITGLEDIADKRVAVQSGSSHEGFLRDVSAIEPVVYPSLKQALISVSDGATDALVGNLATVAYWIRKANLTNLKVAAPADNDVDNLHMAVRKDWPVLVRLLNKGLASVTHQEEQEILQRWAGGEFTPGLDPILVRKYVVNTLLMVVPVLVVFLIWNYKLRKEVAKRRTIEQGLRYDAELKDLLSQTSATFVSIHPDEIEEAMGEAVQRIATVLHADAAYLYRRDDEGELQCVIHWSGQSGFVEGQCLLHETEAALPDWRRETLPDDRGSMDLARQVFQSVAEVPGVGRRSIIEVPLEYEGQPIGVFGASSPDLERPWLKDEQAFLRLTGQVFTHALTRKDYEQALQQHAVELHHANARLKELDRLKSMFIASMSHELRTPLNSIIGFTGVILQGMAGELNPVQQGQLARVYQAAKHLLSLITDVIDISKIESGRVDVHVTSFSVSEVVSEAVTTVRPMLEAKGLDLDTANVRELTMNSDRKRVLQCVINFLSNAVKYTEQGRVEVAVRELAGDVEITVTDTGIGISSEDMPRLFEAFERFESHLKVKAGGTGLGLYLTRKIVIEMLYGSMVVRSAPGQGSTFGMLLPADIGTTPLQPDKMEPDEPGDTGKEADA